MKLSLVVPCYNEAENVQAFQDATIEAFKDCGYDYEIVFIDDGSKDGTLHGGLAVTGGIVAGNSFLSHGKRRHIHNR